MELSDDRCASRGGGYSSSAAPYYPYHASSPMHPPPPAQVHPMLPRPVLFPVVQQQSNFTVPSFRCCDDPKVLCDAILCPYCQIARQQNVLINERASPFSLACGMAMLLDAAGAVFVFLFPRDEWRWLASAACVFNFCVRRKIRSRYNIHPQPIEDLFLSWCCLPCAIAQQNREMALRGADPGSTLRTAAPPASGPSDPQLVLPQYVDGYYEQVPVQRGGPPAYIAMGVPVS